MSEEKIYTPQEERLNILSHGAGIVISLVVGILFLHEAVDRGAGTVAIASLLLYLFGMLSSYVFSTTYHASKPGTKLRKRMRKLDHSAIYWYIAGSYSPITLISMRDSGWWGWGIFAFCWLCAILGTSLSLYSLKKHSKLETLCYVLMGLTIIVAMKQFYDAVSLSAFLWVIGEGVAYITGALLYSQHKVKYIHFVFHLFVILGTFCHMMAVWEVILSMNG
jgi:hemolysin III